MANNFKPNNTERPTTLYFNFATGRRLVIVVRYFNCRLMFDGGLSAFRSIKVFKVTKGFLNAIDGQNL